MTTECVIDLFHDRSLRQHIVDMAKELTDNRKWQCDLIGSAWYRLGETDAQKTVQFYKMLAVGAMKKRLLMLMYGEVECA